MCFLLCPCHRSTKHREGWPLFKREIKADQKQTNNRLNDPARSWSSNCIWGNMTQATVSVPFSSAFRACPTEEKTQQVPKELTFEGVTYVFTYENIRSSGMYKRDKKVSWGRSLLTHSGSRAACVQLKSHKQVSAPGL